MPKHITLWCYLTFFLSVFSLFGTMGCIIIRPKAETILTIDQLSEEASKTTIGIRQVIWTEDSETLQIVGYGWHPREHESYAFIANEGHPRTDMERWLLLESNDTSSNQFAGCEIKLAIHPGFLDSTSFDGPAIQDPLHFSGRAVLAHKAKVDKKTIELEDVSLQCDQNPLKRIAISGSIVARKTDADKFSHLREYYGKPRHLSGSSR